MRRGYVLLIGCLVAVTFVGAITAVHLWRLRSTPSPLSIPDLSRWPAELGQRVTALELDLLQGKNLTESRGQLASLYFANGYTERAEKNLQALLKEDPENPRWPYLLATLELRKGDKNGAAMLLEKTVALAPDYVPALYQRGDLLATSGKRAEAKTFFERALKLSPETPTVLYSLAKLEEAQGHEDAALDLLDSISKRTPEFQEAHSMLAELLEKKGDIERSKEQSSYLRETKSSPPMPDPWLDEVSLLSYDTYRLEALGEARMESNRLDAALPYLKRALSLDPSDVNLRDELAKTLSDLKRYAEARDVLEKGLGQVGDTSSLQIRLAEVMGLDGHPTDAASLLEEAIKKNPDKPALYITLGQILLQLDRAEDAAHICREALRLNPTLVAAHLNLGRALRKLGRKEEARAELQQALKMRPDGVETLGAMASFELENQDFDTAEMHAQKLVSVDPGNREPRALLARVELQKGAHLAEAGRNEEAEHSYLQGISADESSGQLHGALGMLYGKQKRFPEALAQFKQYLVLSPNDPFGYLLLGSVYQNLGNIIETRETWTQGLSVARKAGNQQRAAQLDHLINSLPP